MKTQREYCLIVTAMQKGFAEEAMEAARAAGAAGGSVLTAATLGDKKAEQLIGVTLQKETDVLLILAKNDGKDAITEAILKKVGLKTDGGGVVFTLPVDSIAGVGGTVSTPMTRPAPWCSAILAHICPIGPRPQMPTVPPSGISA